MSELNSKKTAKPASGDLLLLLKPYLKLIVSLAILGFVTTALSLFVPQLTSISIDSFNQTGQIPISTIITLAGVVVGIFALTFTQSILGAYTSEKVAYNLRNELIQTVSEQEYSFINTQTPGKLLTYFTADVNEVKSIISQSLVTAITAILTLFGAAGFLLFLNWQLALMALTIVPFVAITFGFVFGKIGVLFRRSQENLEKINRVISESILAASLIRVLNSQASEIKKFTVVNSISKEIGQKIITLFASLIPVINLLSNLATLLILWFGGQQVVSGNLSIGNFSAFFSYLGMLIFPIFLLGFIGSSFSRALVSLGRIQVVLQSKSQPDEGSVVKLILGNIEFKHVFLELNNRSILRDISFRIQAGTKTALIGPTAAGKSQIFALLAGLVAPTSGEILIDGIPLNNYNRDSFYSQMGLVFQDSIIFNTSLAENINFRNDQSVSDELGDKFMQKAIGTAALNDLVETLPEGLETIIAERGSNLSGGQKQRLMLARALSINPKILLLDDFTARVDIQTEQNILKNLNKNYSGITLFSITQKIQPITNFDSILLIMDGEIIAEGKHAQLLENSLEYQQIWESQETA